MTAPPPSPPRLHVLARPESPHAVVIRRGPAKVSCTIGWDLRTDRFTVGQWVKARIYELRSDISPDGRWLLYFALNGRWQSEAKGSWSALSRAPYLKAVQLWPQGDTWGGGGLILAHPKKHPCARRVAGGFAVDIGAHYDQRLVRDGWRKVGAGPTDARTWGEIGAPPQDALTYERPVPGGVLRKHTAWVSLLRGGATYRESHQLVLAGATTDHPSWEWADLVRGRLVWAERGVLYAARPPFAGAAITPRALYDFNGMTFTPIRAPY